MGWFSSSTAATPISREDREACWEFRDAYFACLDLKGVTVPGEEGRSCKPELDKYEGKCGKTWVDYFNKRRVLAVSQAQTLAAKAAQDPTRKP